MLLLQRYNLKNRLQHAAKKPFELATSLKSQSDCNHPHNRKMVLSGPIPIVRTECIAIRTPCMNAHMRATISEHN
jgi:hypothetical protein